MIRKHLGFIRMNFCGNRFSKNQFIKMLLIGLGVLCCGAINIISFLSSSSLSNIPEIAANHVSVLAKKDDLKRANISISDEYNLLSINKYHVCMMSYIGKNNSIFGTYPELCDNAIRNDNQDLTINNVDMFGLTNYGDGYVYGTTDIPYGITIIEGNYSPTEPLFSDSSPTTGCVISEGVRNKLFSREESAIGKTISFNKDDETTELSIVAVAKDTCLCNDFKESPFILANFVALQRLNGGKCCLKLRLKDNYYTNYSIFHTLFSKVYINGYSTNKLSLDFGDERLNSFVYLSVTKNSVQKNVSFLVIVSFGLEGISAFIFLYFYKKIKIKISKSGTTLFAFGSLLVSYLLGLCTNHLFMNHTYLSTRSSIITIVTIANVAIFIACYSLLSHIIKGKNQIVGDDFYSIDI